MRKGILFLAFFILFLTEVSQATTYIAVEEPELNGAVVLVADLDGQGQLSMLVGQGHNVFAFDGAVKVALINDIPGQISALAIGDLNGDLRDDLVVGTDSGGALYFYAEKDGVWQRQGQPQYLWDRIRHLEVHDFNNDGWGDLLVLTEQGVLQALLSSEGRLYPFWKSPSDEMVVGIEVLDVDHNGYLEIVYTLHSGYIGILTWDDQEFGIMWENFPWGFVESLVVLPHEESPEWLVVTSQKMLYGWRWRNDEVVSSRLFQGNELGEHLFYFPQEGLLSFSQKTGISLFELESNSVNEKWRVPRLFGDRAFRYGGEFYFRDKSKAYYRLTQGGSLWRVFVHDQEVTELVTVLNRDGQLYYRIPDLAQPLGFVVVPENSWCYVHKGHDIQLYPGESVVRYDNLAIPLADAILEIEGLPYASAEVFTLFGWRVEQDASRQHVVFLRNWGWWL